MEGQLDCLKMLSWEEIVIEFPDQWIVVGNPEFEGMNLVNGIIIAHHTDNEIASMNGGKRAKELSKNFIDSRR